jgi:hypothetical protein
MEAKRVFRTRYRIIEDAYEGYEAQFRPWWSPWWAQCFFANTSRTIEQAEQVARVHSGVVVKHLDL